MGKFKDENGKTRMAAILESLGDAGKPILQAAAGLTGQPWLSAIADGIKSSGELKTEQKQILLKQLQLEIQDTQSARDNETARDNSEYSSWLSKNIHEVIALIFCLPWVVSWFTKIQLPDASVQAVMLILGYLYGRSRPQS